MKLKGALILTSTLAFILAACGTTGLSTKKEDRKVFYAAEEGLKLYPEPQFSENSIAELPLNEKVLRYRIEKGFAYVEVQRTGQKGWVDNARLKWRLEAQNSPSVQPSPAPREVNETAADAASPEKADEASSPESTTSPDASTPSNPATKKPDASVLDSF